MTGGLFELPPPPEPPKEAMPLAERMRPRSIDEILGQEATRDGALLRSLIDGGRLPSLLLWGPPGCGKTSLARLLADVTGLSFLPFSAVLGGVKELRERIDEARQLLRRGTRALLFVDEIHHFSKSQQDALLPHVESGLVTLVGATTENPSFHVNAALLSRCTVVPLKAVPEADLAELARRALVDVDRGLGRFAITLDPVTLGTLVATSHGDVRAMLNRLEALVTAAAARGTGRTVAPDEAARLLADKRLAHDAKGDAHYDLASALQKSIRGGDPQATLYWLARMIEGGEDPLFIARRLVRTASEDIGLADPGALRVALDALEAYRFLGTPEGELALAEAAVYLATAPKSPSVYKAFGEIRAAIAAGKVPPVPAHLRNAPTALAKSLGHGVGYEYPPDLPHAVSDQSYLPPELEGASWYRPSAFGHEKDVARRMAWWDEMRAKIREGKKGES